MGCENFEERYSCHLDGVLEDWERDELLAHREVCPRCHARSKAIEDLRGRLRRLAAPRIPAALTVQLRVLASHEHARRLARLTFATRLRTSMEILRLHFENLMRPVAVPLAGGVLSALLLFGTLVPTLSFRRPVTNDPPLAFADPHAYVDPHGDLVNWVDGEMEAPRLEPLDSAVSSDENVLELTVNNQGRVVDYTVLQGQFTPDMATIIEFSQLTPATFLGKPTWGKTLVVLPGRRSRSRRG
ncbi:MAG TPA: hypothetical protein VKV17_04190 [Bryobacteraceae bacterium]|nr:hypothetical protein [Bryobacteraceae bacterium]